MVAEEAEEQEEAAEAEVSGMGWLAVVPGWGLVEPGHCLFHSPVRHLPFPSSSLCPTGLSRQLVLTLLPSFSFLTFVSPWACPFRTTWGSGHMGGTFAPSRVAPSSPPVQAWAAGRGTSAGTLGWVALWTETVGPCCE